MILDDRNFYKSYEIIGGEKIMAPAAPLAHSGTLFRLGMIIGNYLVENNCGYVFPNDVDVHLSDGNLFKPDLVVIKKENKHIMDWKRGIYGVPDMVVEVLSKSTQKKDVTVKKDSYEACGVKEYWIINPYMETVDTYVLQDGKYILTGEYINYSDYDMEQLNDEQKAEAKFEITLAIFPDLTIQLKDIFAWGFFTDLK